MKRTGLIGAGFLCTVVSGMFLSGAANAEDGVRSEFMSEGFTQVQGGYRPVRAEMDEEADIVTKSPEDLKNPKFGFLVDGDLQWAFILDESEEGEQTLYVDANADGDLTNDPEVSWKAGRGNMYQGSAVVELAGGKEGKINMYRFDPNDERRAALKNTVLFYPDYGSQLVITLDGKEFKTAVASPKAGDSIYLDRNGDGRRSRNFEALTLGEPFNFTGTTYILEPADGEMVLAKADKELPLAPLPPDLSVGKSALEFAATTMEGEEIEFPTTFKGKVVMVDFWATWCGPCVGEIPHMKEAYSAWHDQGFEILGISFDQKDMEEKVQKFRESREIPWPQIYEGKFWDTTLGKQHDVSGIPFVLVVDGDTGKILGTSKEARGPGLTKFIGEQLLSKGKITEEQLSAALESDDDEEEGDDK